MKPSININQKDPKLCLLNKILKFSILLRLSKFYQEMVYITLLFLWTV